MADFVASDPGLCSRFPRTIAFPDYSTDELVRIFRKLAGDQGLRLGDGVEARVRSLLDGADRGDGFGNGRLVRDLLQHMLGRQALRLTGDNLTDEELQTLTADDIVWVAPPPRTGPRLGFAPPGAQRRGGPAARHAGLKPRVALASPYQPGGRRGGDAPPGRKWPVSRAPHPVPKRLQGAGSVAPSMTSVVVLERACDQPTMRDRRASTEVAGLPDGRRTSPREGVHRIAA